MGLATLATATVAASFTTSQATCNARATICDPDNPATPDLPSSPAAVQTPGFGPVEAAYTQQGAHRLRRDRA
jgi:hypothetical protein